MAEAATRLPIKTEETSVPAAKAADWQPFEALRNGTLTIKGEKQEQKEEKTKDRYVSERRYGSFRRSLQVPGSVDAGKIEANYKGGVLTITMPKSPDAQNNRKTIPVTAT